ncbi:MAG: hypothetical protein AAB851_02005 [Patescibacteria group bacterium]
MTLEKKIFDNLIEHGRQKEWKEYSADAAENELLNNLLREKKATYETVGNEKGEVVREIIKDLNGNVIYDEIPWNKEKSREERFLKDIAKSSDKRANN